MDLFADPTRAVFVANLAVPLAAFLLNATARWAVKVPQSSPSDFVLVLLIFDFSVLANPAIAITGILAREIQQHSNWWFVALTIYGLGLWWILIARLDTTLAKYQVRASRNQARAFPWFGIVLGWSMSGAYLYTHLLLFTFKGSG